MQAPPLPNQLVTDRAPHIEADASQKPSSSRMKFSGLQSQQHGKHTSECDLARKSWRSVDCMYPAVSRFLKAYGPWHHLCPILLWFVLSCCVPALFRPCIAPVAPLYRPMYRPCIAPVSPLYRPCIAPVSPLCRPCVAPVAPMYLPLCCVFVCVFVFLFFFVF